MAEKERENGKKANPHAGHRERLRTQFRQNGLEGFTDVQALEILLFFAFRQGDTNVTAHRLLEHFGTFRGVMEAGAAELEEVVGIGETASTLITLVAELNRRYLGTRRKLGVRLETSDQICDYLRDLFRYKTVEEVYMLFLNGDRQVLGLRRLGVGTVASVELSTREAAMLALREHAAGVVLTHNHLVTNALPSNADVEATRRLFQALYVLGIELIDHVIVADDDAVSMRDSRQYNQIWQGA